MVSVLVWIVAYCRFKSRSGQDKDCKIGISCFSIKHAASRRKSKYLLVPNQENVFEWSDMSTNRLLFHCTDLSNLVGLEQSGHHHHFIDCSLFWSSFAEYLLI